MKRKIILFIPLILLIFIIGFTLADRLDNDVRVNINSDLTYYLSVKYDGVDVFGNVSSDEVVAEVYSDIINVIDQIPEGLIFTGFVLSEDGTIGAVRRDNNMQCLGKVVDDTNESENDGKWNSDNTEYTYHGLHYNALTRTVSFKVNNLKAGCVLNIGIKVRTPETVDDPNTIYIETRRDFYNYAIAYENVQKAISNVVHVFIGSDNSTMYSVTYEITGDIPDDYISPPSLNYLKGTIINVDNNIIASGYIFNGWTSNDVEIIDNTFVMPDKNVVLTGSFTQVTPFKVIYNIIGDVPSKYVVPLEKNYYEGSDVILDSLKQGDKFNNYLFNGWTSNDVEIIDNTFVMPNKNVIINGSFDQLKYKVIYKFQGSVLPDNYEGLLPITMEYNYGDIVTLSNVEDVEGYVFLGWNRDNNFIMPNEDVIVYGEWKRQNGEFEPSISLQIIDDKDYYQVGDTIKYKATITNPEDFAINSVIVIEDNENAIFNNNTDYEVINNVITIDSINAHDSVDIYYDYIITNEDGSVISNEVELVGALADNYYELKNGEYKASVSSNLQSKLKICTTIDGIDVGNTFSIKVYNNNIEYGLNLKNNECNTLFINPGTYKIFEIIPQEYFLESVTGNISSNDENLTIVQGTNYQVNFVNKFKRKKFMHMFGEVINKIRGGNS